MPKKKTETVDLPCQLTGPEKIQKGDEAAGKHSLIRRLEDQLKNESSGLRAKIKAERTAFAELMDQIVTGEEIRPVETFERMLFDVSKVETVRCDTGKVISTRGMHPNERQRSMEFDGPNPGVKHPAGERKKRDHKAERARRKEQKDLEAVRRVNSPYIEPEPEQAEVPAEDEHTEH